MPAEAQTSEPIPVPIIIKNSLKDEPQTVMVTLRAHEDTVYHVHLVVPIAHLLDGGKWDITIDGTMKLECAYELGDTAVQVTLKILVPEQACKEALYVAASYMFHLRGQLKRTIDFSCEDDNVSAEVFELFHSWARDRNN